MTKHYVQGRRSLCGATPYNVTVTEFPGSERVTATWTYPNKPSTTAYLTWEDIDKFIRAEQWASADHLRLPEGL